MMTTDNSDNFLSRNDEGAAYGKLFFLMLSSMFLAVFVPLSVFASVPIAIGILLFGRMRGIGVALLCAVLFFVVAVNYHFVSPILGFIYLFALLNAVIVAEVVMHNIHPVKGIVKFGIILIAIAFLLLGFLSLLSAVSIEKQLLDLFTSMGDKIKVDNAELLAQGGDDARMLQDFIAKPQIVVKMIIQWLPSTLFVGIFSGLWISLLMVLRGKKAWSNRVAYSFTIHDLMKFKVHEVMIWPVIVALTLALTGDYFFGEIGPVIGGNVLYCLGVFYFFQGLGIYLDFLTFARIFGFFRTVLTVFTIIVAWKLIAVVGIFDMWVNFRKLFSRKKNNDTNDKSDDEKNNDNDDDKNNEGDML